MGRKGGVGGARKHTVQICTRGEQHGISSPSPSLGGGRVAHPQAVRGRGGEARLGEGGESSTKERVLEGIIWLHSRLRVIVQHPENEVLESAVITRGVTRFPLTNAARTTNLHS